LIRKAKIPDLDQVIHLLYDDGLGRDRESISNKYKQKYLSVFSELLESKYFDIFVMEINNEIIGFYQIMYLPHISFKGSKRGQVESVRIRSDSRRSGLGTKLMKHAIEVAGDNGCSILQLTSNKKRKEIGKFYKNLGFSPTHDGYKLYF